MKPRAMNLETGDLLPPSLVGVMVLLDRSGSMRALRSPMEAAFTEFVQAQREDNPHNMWLSLYQFDSEGYDASYERTPIGEVGALGLSPRGGTPLIDSLYRMAQTAKAVIADQNDPTERLLLVVITDGEENASKDHTWTELRVLLAEVEGADCELIFMGTTDAVLQAEDNLPSMAAPGSTFSYTPTAAGATYAAGGLSVGAMSMKYGGSAKGVTRSYAAASAHGQHVMSQAKLKAWTNEQVQKLKAAAKDKK